MHARPVICLFVSALAHKRVTLSVVFVVGALCPGTPPYEIVLPAGHRSSPDRPSRMFSSFSAACVYFVFSRQRTINVVKAGPLDRVPLTPSSRSTATTVPTLDKSRLSIRAGRYAHAADTVSPRCAVAPPAVRHAII